MTYTLYIPTKLVTQSSEAFVFQVLLAASIAKVSVEVVADSTEHAEKPAGYPLPILVERENNTSTVFVSGKAAVQKMLGEDCNTLESLVLEDAYCKLATVVLDEGRLEESLFKAVELKTKTTQVLVAGLVRVSKDIPESIRSWYTDFISSHSAALARVDSHSVSRTEQRVKETVLFVNDTSETKLPKKDCRNVLITAALPYVNNVPHLGNIIGAVLSADVFARYCRLRGYQTLYICGTDEYGTATETKALEEGISCADLCAKYFKLHAGIYEWFGVSTDIFGRSSTPKQTQITHEIFNGLYKNGYFIEQSVEQTYCETCTRFLADRYVEGTCPLCSYNDARGDQCDGCGKLVNPTELKEPRCKICRSTPVVRSSDHLFLDLTKLQPQIDDFVSRQSVAGRWASNCTAISKAWLHEGLKPRCMTRDLRWGTPVPVKGFEEKVFYVWFDACFGYISITANYTDDWRQWWQSNQADTPKVELYQFMGKDNAPFHAVIFPATLLGTVKPDSGDNCPWTLAHHISTTEYLNYESGKFSKSRSIGVFGNDARDSGIPAAVWRYYLLVLRPEATDSAFSWEEFGTRNNTELLANLGNFVSRITKFAVAKYDGIIPGIQEFASVDQSLIERVNLELCSYIDAMESVHIKSALKTAMAISSLGNGYLTEAGLDNRLLKEQPARCATIITVALNLAYLLSALLDPFIPTSAEDIRKNLNAPVRTIPDSFEIDVLLQGHQLGQPFHLFTRLDEVRLTELRSKFSGKQVK